MMKQNTIDLFMDKIKLSALVVDKTGQLIGAFADLQNKMAAKFIDDENLKESREWRNNWRLMLELHSFIYCSKIEKHKNITQDEKDKVSKTIDNFIYHKDKNTFNDLVEVYKLILKFVSLSGYMDDKFVNRKDGSLEDEENG